VAAAVASAVGPPPGAVVLRSDEIRKELLGVDPLTRLGADAYTSNVSTRVYRELAERARVILSAGHAVVADAVFSDGHHSQALEALAAELGVPFTGVWLHAPLPTLLARVTARRGDASDADADVVRHQWATQPAAPHWTQVDASGTTDEVVHNTRAVL
jgi:predicted kinase